MKKLYLAIVILLLTGLCSAVGSASTISISPVSIPGIGMSSTATISLDSADQGLSGYIMSVYPESPQVVSIAGVTFPNWAILSEAAHGEGAAYTIRALDMNEAIGPGAKNIPLATLNLNGVTSGSTRIRITSYNVCYTKLLRDTRPSGSPPCSSQPPAGPRPRRGRGHFLRGVPQHRAHRRGGQRELRALAAAPLRRGGRVRSYNFV